MKKIKYIFFTSILITQFCSGQNVDSLWKVYNNKEQPDTVRLKAIDAIANSYVRHKPDTAIILAEQELKLASSLPFGKSKGWIANTFNIIGIAYQNKSNFPKALEYDLKALQLREEIQDKKGIANSYSWVGIVYRRLSNYPKALQYGLKALKINEDMNNKQGIGNCYVNVGNIYNLQADYPKALDYFLKALRLKEETKDKQGIGTCYNNIGVVYGAQSNYPKALKYYLKGLEISREIGSPFGRGLCYLNIGSTYNSLASYKLAIQYSDSCLQIAKEIGEVDGQRLVYENLALAYSKMGKYKEAYEYHVKFKQLTDSIFNEENSKQLGDLKTKFEVEKKEAELKIKSNAEQDKLKAVSLEEKKRQNIVIGAVVGVLFIVLVFFLFLFNRFRITNRQKVIIEKQKEQVDRAYESLHEKNKEVMDSINYAGRIQRALLPSQKYIVNQLNRLMKNY